jgi:DNA repair protein RAD57
MAQRSSELVKLGKLLRDLARDENCAVVVANQVADRFTGGVESPILDRATQISPLSRRSAGNVPDSSTGGLTSSLPVAEPKDTAVMPFKSTMDPMSLDHQQRWFTGWGDDRHPSHLIIKNMKTPSLGLIWTTQIACRIALIRRPVYGPGLMGDEENERGEPVLRKWRRWIKVVFAPHVAPSGPGLEGAVEFEITGEGMRAVKKKGKNNEDDDEDDALQM